MSNTLDGSDICTCGSSRACPLHTKRAKPRPVSSLSAKEAVQQYPVAQEFALRPDELRYLSPLDTAEFVTLDRYIRDQFPRIRMNLEARIRELHPKLRSRQVERLAEKMLNQFFTSCLESSR